MAIVFQHRNLASLGGACSLTPYPYRSRRFPRCRHFPIRRRRSFPQGGSPLPALPAPVQHQQRQATQANERQQRPQVRMAMVVGLGRGGRRILLLFTSFFDG